MRFEWSDPTLIVAQRLGLYRIEMGRLPATRPCLFKCLELDHFAKLKVFAHVVLYAVEAGLYICFMTRTDRRLIIVGKIIVGYLLAIFIEICHHYIYI